MAKPSCNVPSPKLFQPDGIPLEFYMWPCEERARLRGIIEKNGGNLKKSADDKIIIRLVPDGSIVKSDDCFFSQFIDDCVAESQLKNLEDYRVTKKGCTPVYYSCSKVKTQSNKVSSSEKSEENNNIIRCSSKAKQGRKAYTLNDDLAILEYLVKKEVSQLVGGNVIWKEMEKKMDLGHSWNSMKDHYNKVMKKKLKTYPIPNSWFQILLHGKTGIHEDNKTTSSKPKVRKIQSSDDKDKERLSSKQKECSTVRSPYFIKQAKKDEDRYRTNSKATCDHNQKELPDKERQTDVECGSPDSFDTMLGNYASQGKQQNDNDDTSMSSEDSFIIPDMGSGEKS